MAQNTEGHTAPNKIKVVHDHKTTSGCGLLSGTMTIFDYLLSKIKLILYTFIKFIKCQNTKKKNCYILWSNQIIKYFKYT